MFAFALWDQREQKLLLARDRFGKKPLYYALSGGRLLFGSEIKAIFAVAPELATIDPEGILSFFYFGYIPDPLTAFTQIRKLSPGHLLEFSNGHIRIRKYWELPKYGVYEPRSEAECIEEMEERLTAAVRARLVSDVPLGALLSGGVDSSTMVALMSRVSSRQVQTFSIAFSSADFNEADHARVVAQKFGTEHHELLVDPQIEETAHMLTRSLEEPFADSSMVPTYHVCRLARQYVTVALAGDGGDELFAGYDRYRSYLRTQDATPYFRRAAVGSIANLFTREFRPNGAGGDFFTMSRSRLSERYLDSIAILPACVRDRSMFSKDFLAWADKQPSPYDIFRRYLANNPTSDPLSEVQYLDAKTYLPGDILTKVDRMSMATSLEVRAPFLDHTFAEWAARLSPRWKMRGGEPKYILKKLAEKLGVPREVLYRRKQGFSMPLVHWFRQDPSPALLEILQEPRTIQRGYFNADGLRRRLDEHKSGWRDRSWEIWQLLIFELWHRNFLEPAVRLESSVDVCSPRILAAATVRQQALAVQKPIAAH